MSKPVRNFKCVNNPNDFCNVCGEFSKGNKTRPFNEKLQKHYLDYFGIPPSFTHPWTPKYLCNYCRLTLNKWSIGKR